MSHNKRNKSRLTDNTSQENEKKIDSKSKAIIKTVMEKCRKEKYSNKLLVPIEDYEERVSYYTGVPKTLVYKLNGEQTVNSKAAVDPKLRSEISSAIRDLYLKQESHTYQSVYEKIYKTTKDPNCPQFSHFRHEMASLGYDYKKTLDGCILMEDPKLTFERFHYLKKMKNIRDKGQYIYYIDERILNFEKDLRKPWEKKHEPEVKVLHLFHMISKYGYENGLFCYQATADDFLKWIIDIILPILKPNSAIVIDNGPLHGKLENAPISRYHTKEDMLKWLRNNNIPCSAGMHKAELFQLIDKCSSRTQQYHLDRILKANGHEVLRLPTNYLDLTPTYLLWKDVALLSDYWDTPLDSPTLKERINQTIASVPSYKWLEYDESTMTKENMIAGIDAEISLILESYTLDVEHILTEHASHHEENGSN